MPRNHVLVGLPGAGKTTVGRVLARRLGWRLVDTDDEVVREAGMSVAEIFRTEGEPAFRALEAKAVGTACAGERQVVATGGGAVLLPENRGAMRAGGNRVNYLFALPRAALGRLGGPPGNRPLLAGADPAGVIARLFAQRDPLYRATAHATYPTWGSGATELAARIAASGDERRLHVELGSRSYPVLIGDGVLARIGDIVPDLPGRRRAVVVTEAGIGARYAPAVTASLNGAGLETSVVTMGEGEAVKTLATVELLYGAFQNAALTRNDIVVALGGGVVGDTAGFAASTYLRGIDVVQVPTTSLAMVDSAIGGKTGVNFNGKNLVGAFWQPLAVVADVATLASLPERVYVEGLAELVKHAFIADTELLADLEAQAPDLLGRHPGVLADVLARSANVKCRLVSADEREGGERAFLNYGHTFGHALETASGALAHGEAIAVGMTAAAHLASRVASFPADAGVRQTDLLVRLGLPVTADVPLRSALPYLARDKKALDGLRFVLLEDFGKPILQAGIPETAVADAFAAVGVR